MAGKERRYSEHEASLILKRAGELAVNQGDSRQMSLAELEAAADEAGIDTALVRRAAAELSRQPAAAPPDNLFLGGPTSLVFEAFIDGEVEPAAHEHFVNLVRRRTGEQGSHDVIGRTLTWASGPRLGNQVARNMMVTITPSGGVTSIRVEERLGQLAGGLFGGILGGVGGGGIGLWLGPLIVAGYPALIPVAMAAWLGGVYALVRRIYRGKTKARADDLRELLKSLVSLAEDCVAGSGPRALPA